jgi:hypothetical protein
MERGRVTRRFRKGKLRFGMTTDDTAGAALDAQGLRRCARCQAPRLLQGLPVQPLQGPGGWRTLENLTTVRMALAYPYECSSCGARIVVATPIGLIAWAVMSAWLALLVYLAGAPRVALLIAAGAVLVALHNLGLRYRNPQLEGRARRSGVAR